MKKKEYFKFILKKAQTKNSKMQSKPSKSLTFYLIPFFMY